MIGGVVFEEVDAQVEAFLKAHSDVAIKFAPPAAEVAEPAVHVHLMELDVPVRYGASAPAPLEVLLRYLVTVHDADAKAAHGRLGRIVVAALSTDDLQAQLRPLPPDAWRAFGVAPQPSLLLEAVARRAREARFGPPVKELVLRLRRATDRISGVVLTPDKKPFVGAEVVLVGLGRRTRTDGRGRFAFENVPQPLDNDRLEVRAKGFVATANAGPEPVEVRLGPEE